MNPAEWDTLLAMMAAPFEPSFVKWRAGAVSRDRKRAQALPYVDPRAYEERLDEIAGGAWGVTFKPWGERRLICELSIHGQTRSSTGEFDDSDTIAQGTTAEAQAFKRACAKFGLGRYLYEIPSTWVPYDQDRRKLQETPELSGRFIPGGAQKALKTREVHPGPSTPERETLTPERSAAMRRELEKLGLPLSEQATFAAAALGRKVGAFTELTDAEATEVWNAARRTHA